MVERRPDFLPDKEKEMRLRHVALVMDGNRRWAKLHGKLVIEGHQEGKERIEPIVKRAEGLGIDVVSFYTLSLENLERPEEDVKRLLGVLKDGFTPMMERLREENMRFHFLGDISRFPPDLQDNFRQAEAISREKTGITVNLALAYGGRDEIVRAFKQIVSIGISEENINEELIGKNLDTAGQPDPDLVIRTGGRARLSGYLTWQTVYSEIYFSDTLWPDYTVEEFDKAISWYNRRVRTFGR